MYINFQVYHLHEQGIFAKKKNVIAILRGPITSILQMYVLFY